MFEGALGEPGFHIRESRVERFDILYVQIGTPTDAVVTANQQPLLYKSQKIYTTLSYGAWIVLILNLKSLGGTSEKGLF